MEKKIITISREYGSGGCAVGTMVAERLGIPLYDKELIEKIASESGLTPEYVKENGEHSPGNNLYAYAPHSISGVEKNLHFADSLWETQRDIILQLAEQGPCVIVGRNADYILRDREDTLNVYIFADKDFRTDRIVNLYHEGTDNPEAQILEADNRRWLNYQHYTGQTWGQSQNYDLCLSTSELGIDLCADIICEIVNRSKN